MVDVAARQLTTLEAVAHFERDLRQLAAMREERYWLLDFAGATFFLTPAVNTLLTIMRRLRSLGGELVLAGISQDVCYVLGLLRLDAVFTLAPSASAGLAQLRAAAQRDPRRAAEAG